MLESMSNKHTQSAHTHTPSPRAEEFVADEWWRRLCSCRSSCGIPERLPAPQTFDCCDKTRHPPNPPCIHGSFPSGATAKTLESLAVRPTSNQAHSYVNDCRWTAGGSKSTVHDHSQLSLRWRYTFFGGGDGSAVSMHETWVMSTAHRKKYINLQTMEGITQALRSTYMVDSALATSANTSTTPLLFLNSRSPHQHIFTHGKAILSCKHTAYCSTHA